MLAPGGRFCSSSTTRCCRRRTAAGSTTRSSTRPSSTGGSAPTSSRTRRSRRSRRACSSRFIHRPLSRYVNALAGNGPAASSGWTSRRRPPGFLARAAEYADAATIPRLLLPARRKRPTVQRSDRGGVGTLTAVTDIVVITGLSGAGRSQAADVLEDLGWFVVDNLPTVAHREGRRAGQRAGRAPSSGWPSSWARARTRPTSSTPSSALRAGGHRVRILFLEASTPELVRRYESTRRRHPLGDGRHGAARGHRARARSCSSRSRPRPTSSSTPPTSTSTSCKTG